MLAEKDQQFLNKPIKSLSQMKKQYSLLEKQLK